jgi:hypothetical protein
LVWLSSKRRAFYAAAFVLCAALLIVIVPWLLVNHTSLAGPLLANTLRRTIGSERVTRLEEISYGVADRVNRWRHRNEVPKARWTPPVAEPLTAVATEAAGALVTFHPASVGPFSSKWHAPGDGDWVPIADPRHASAPPLMFKTLLHPDVNRSWADLFVVAVSLEHAQLHARAGTGEPRSDNGVPAVPRPGRVAPDDVRLLLAAFNGGFMAEHGRYGMRVDGVNLLKPRAKSCTVVGYTNDSVQIATWDTVQDSEGRMRWFRQTPACMYENNTMHVGLRQPETRLWGATLDGDTVIRRSAIGLDESRRVLFVGISNNTTARALAEGMHHAGAVDVAQLDVNWSYPKFLLYRQGDKGELVAVAPVDGFEFHPGEYVSKSAYRDFFYLTRRDPAEETPCPNCPKSK